MMTQAQQICVYCSARDEVDPVYMMAARNLGKELVTHGKSLVYGGGSHGLMGAITDAVIEHGGHVTGIMPEHLRDVEKMHPGVQNLIIVDTMHQRKQRMAEMADAFIILPGGFGTMDEFFEILTWRQLKLHDKPIIVVNINGFWTHLLDLVQHMAAGKFISLIDLDNYTVVNTIEDVLPTLLKEPDPCIPTRTELA